MKPERKRFIILTIGGLAICYLGITYLSRGIANVLNVEDFSFKLSITLFSSLFLAIALIFYVLKKEQRSLRSIGFKKFKAKRDVLWGFAGFFLGSLSFFLTIPLLNQLGLGGTGEGISLLATLPWWLRILISINAGVTEEILLRGYPIERLTEWIGNIWIAAGISVLLFAGLHLSFWSLGGAIQIGISTIIWTLIYIKTRSLWALIIMHILNDLYAFVLLPLILTGGYY